MFAATLLGLKIKNLSPRSKKQVCTEKNGKSRDLLISKSHLQNKSSLFKKNMIFVRYIILSCKNDK